MEDRKRDHIDLAFQAQQCREGLDDRFYYEPGMAAHPGSGVPWVPVEIGGKTLSTPFWVSSMTGGTTHARMINQRLAKVSRKFGLGMGLGSCRMLLEGDEHWEDFLVRDLLGDDLPLFANLGIAQIEELLAEEKWEQVEAMVERLSADGLIIHLNPMQEWFQPEGDRIEYPPLTTLKKVLEMTDMLIMVKEVGQGMGPRTMEALLAMPLAAIEFGAAGGTNFALLESLRSDEASREAFFPMTHIGHSAEEMVDFVNQSVRRLEGRRSCPVVIISGGIRNFLDGYYLIQKAQMPAVYAQASTLLKYALKNQEALDDYVSRQIEGLKMSYQFLSLKEVGDQ